MHNSYLLKQFINMTKVSQLTLKITILGFLTEANRTVHLVPLMQAVLHRSELVHQVCTGIFSLPLPLAVCLSLELQTWCR